MGGGESRPNYPSADVARLANASVVTTKARTEVVERLRLTDPEAEALIRKIVASISESDFYEPLTNDPGAPADVYGVVDKHGGWYVKVLMKHGRVFVISCHEPRHDMICRNGNKVGGRRR